MEEVGKDRQIRTSIPSDDTQAQFDTSCALFMIDRICSMKRVSRKPVLHPRSQKLAILDWLSLVFVRQPQGDAASVAIQMDSPNVTLLVAIERGIPNADDRAAGDLVMDTLRDLLDTPRSKPEKIEVLDELMLKISSQRIQHKLHMLQTLDLPSVESLPDSQPSRLSTHPTFPLADLISAWRARRNRETSPGLVEYAHRNEDRCPHAMAALQECITKIFELNAQPDVSLFPAETEEQLSESVSAFRRMSSFANLVLSSTFIATATTAPGKHGGASSPECIFLKRFQRRLRRVSQYHTQALMFVERGVVLLESALRAHPHTGLRRDMEIRWVANELAMPRGHGVQYEIFRTPDLVIDRALETADVSYFGRNFDRDLAKQLIETSGVKQVLHDACGASAAPIITHLHAELQLITYLLERDIAVYPSRGDESFIGTSKLSCEACDTYLKELQSRRPLPRWKLSGTSEKMQPTWALPDGPIGSDVARRIQDDCRHMLLDELDRQLEIQRSREFSKTYLAEHPFLSGHPTPLSYDGAVYPFLSAHPTPHIYDGAVSPSEEASEDTDSEDGDD
ncbi:hypothetical protein EWM64_g5262 [Hericium alpestre]|uniref:Uncharacterized protein n=1 Tax=Hericium alpestre TaxID=135208 RepID=A0A4Y9ZXK2_9AGAM|nr:hypothetical protein EWM64_g5262 [Hericium alpestre]